MRLYVEESNFSLLRIEGNSSASTPSDQTPTSSWPRLRYLKYYLSNLSHLSYLSYLSFMLFLSDWSSFILQVLPVLPVLLDKADKKMTFLMFQIVYFIKVVITVTHII
jgi:hypothetical protein